ncbi:hypothetical protein QR680_007942 [Steinernema hermaphroditum]|uniref:Uncharacterized protein n=1 Tax=Steinernema hermaphroditum TaxID=289476 RepID=A0AA39M771_9BILA|nr:hypothetical protein QR680_007942 [Steinernema hermaphroditum]
MPFKLLSGQVALVTGASRGIGKGIAVQLGEAGATVYVTGRPPAKQEGISQILNLPTLEQTAQEITKRGGKGIAVFCDHSDPEEVRKLFERIEKEQNGRLDILVNNAYAGVTTVASGAASKFYLDDPSVFEIINNVGLKNHYICSVYAARLMVPRKKGFIVTLSSEGGIAHLFGVAYGVGKSACDRLAADMAHELFDSNICSISLMPGAVKTELIMSAPLDDNVKKYFVNGESIEFSGKCVVALATDPRLMEKTGHILNTTELAKEYNLTDLDRRRPHSEVFDKYRNYLVAMNDVRAPKNLLQAEKSDSGILAILLCIFDMTPSTVTIK